MKYKVGDIVQIEHLIGHDTIIEITDESGLNILTMNQDGTKAWVSESMIECLVTDAKMDTFIVVVRIVSKRSIDNYQHRTHIPLPDYQEGFLVITDTKGDKHFYNKEMIARMSISLEVC